MEAGLNDSILKKNNINTKGHCLFVQRWREIFNTKTFETYKCRLTNTHGILDEYLKIIKKVNEGSIKETHIEPVKVECIRKLKDDIVFKNNSSQLHKLACNKVGSTKGTRVKLISDIEVVKKQLDNQYLTWIIKDLKQSIDEDKLIEIQKHTENLATELVYRGWTKSSLYRLVKIIFFDSQEEFDDKWNKFTSSITSSKEVFKCYIPIKSKLDEYSQSISCRGKDIIENLNCNYKNIINKEIDYLEFKGEAYAEDLNSFTEKVSKELSEIQSEYIYFGQKIVLDTTKVIVILPTKKVTIYNMSKYNAKEYFKNNSVNYKSINLLSEYKEIQSNTSNEEIKTRLNNIFMQYKLGYNSDSVETWFSSFWFALESLVATGQYEYIIDQIINIVTPIVTIRYPKQIIENLIKDFERCSINLAVIGINGYDSENENVIKLVEILKDKNRIKDLESLITDYSLLEIRIQNVSSWLQNSLTLKKFLEAHNTNIEHHLRRLFRIRNEYVHSAIIDTDLYPITMHVHSYLKEVISEIIMALKNGCTEDIKQIYSCSSIKYNIILDKLTSTGKNAYDSSIICFENCCTMI